MHRPSIEEELREHILTEHLPGEDPDCLGLDDELLDSGILDSLAVVQVAVWTERRFGVRVGLAGMTTKNFSTIRRWAAFVRGISVESEQETKAAVVTNFDCCEGRLLG